MHGKLLPLLYVAITLGCWHSAVAQVIGRNSFSIPTSESIKIDGRLDEYAWKDALPLEQFTQILPENNNKVNFRTEVRILQNENFLFFGIFCADSVQDYRVSVRRDFNDEDQDCVGIVLDGFGDKRVALGFVTNPFGAQLDLMVYDDTDKDIQWDGYWYVKTSRTAGGWYAEFALPWKTLRYKMANNNWKLNVFRRVRSINELSAWSPFPRFVTPYRLQYAGDFNVVPPPSGINIRLQPYGLSTSSSTKTDSLTSNKSIHKAGLDVKWALTTKDVLDLTLNTDFAQADVDRRIVNISRSSIFLPERRSFFLENSNLFSDGLKPQGPIGNSMLVIPFFSRRIGIDDFGGTIPIQYGLKYVHRSSRINYGTIWMQQDEQDTSRIFNVNRLSVNFGSQSRAGFLHTLTQRGTNLNQTFSGDVFFRINQQNQIKAMLSSSQNKYGSQGYASFFQFNHVSNKLSFHWRQAIVDKHYDPKAGFISRSDVISTMPGFWLTAQPKWMPKKVLFFEPGIVTEFFHEASTKDLKEYNITYIPFWFSFVNKGHIGLALIDSYQRLDDEINISSMTIEKGEYKYQRLFFLFGTDPSKTVAASILSEIGNFYNGRLSKADIQLTYRANERLRVSQKTELFYFTEFGKYIINKTFFLFTSESQYAFSPRILLSGFVQYNSDQKVWGSNLRLSWEFKPLSFLYIIINNNGINNYETKQVNNTELMKFSLMRQL